MAFNVAKMESTEYPNLRGAEADAVDVDEQQADGGPAGEGEAERAEAKRVVHDKPGAEADAVDVDEQQADGGPAGEGEAERAEVKRVVHDKPIIVETDTRFINAAIFTINKQDHTLGNMIRTQLLKDPRVLFAGYMISHPLDDKFVIRIQTIGTTTPKKVLEDAIKDLVSELSVFEERFKEAIKEKKEEKKKEEKKKERLD